MRCHSVGCGMTRWITQSATRSINSRSKDAVIRVYDDAGNVIEAHEHAGDASTEVSASGPVGPTLPRPSSPASKNGELVV